MNIEYVIYIIALALVPLFFFSSLRKPPKIEETNSWGTRNIENVKITFKNLELNIVPKKEYRYCLLAETEETNEIENVISFHNSINELVAASGHTVLTSRIDYKNKIQWQFYSACPLAAEKLLKNLKLPVTLRVGKIVDPSWSEYLFHSGKT